MASTSQHQLVAILFADIVGYTAMMQRDEKEALVKINLFKKELENKVAAYHGEIIQFYGDGCLSIFKSSVDAVMCAKVLQEEFVNQSDVPVRIGLHAGDVMRKEGNIFGDAVNVASRIESMSVPGAVLLSSNIRNQIKNKPDFELVRLGRFAFKNVDGDMSVYALKGEGLIIPYKNKLGGKLKEKPKKSRMVLWAIVALAIVSGGTWIFQGRILGADVLPAEIRESRVAVIPFTNQTNDKELDRLGHMASNWITQGMMNVDDLKVVSEQSVLDNQSHLSASMGNKRDFSKRTGAEQIITGKYFESGDMLIFQTQIEDLESGEIRILPEVKNLASNYEAIVQDLRDRILSYFAIPKNHPGRDLFLNNPPKYDAYVLWEKGVKNTGPNNLEGEIDLKRAIEIDSLFFWPYISLIGFYIDRSQKARADSIIQVVDQRFKRLTPYERLYYERSKNWTKGDMEAVYRISKDIFAKDPNNLSAILRAGISAAAVNRHLEAVNYLQRVNLSDISNDVVKRDFKFWHAHSLIRLNRLEEAMNILNQDHPDNIMWSLKVELYARMSQQDSILQLIQKKEELNPNLDEILRIYLRASNIFAILKDKENQHKWANLAIEKIKGLPETVSFPERWLATAYYYGEELDKAIPLFEKILNENGVNNHVDAFLAIRLAHSYALQGKKKEALNLANRLEEIEAEIEMGLGEYALGGVYAGLGEKEKAVEYLKQAFRQGIEFNHVVYKYAVEQIPLHGYPPFEEFVRTK